MARPADPQKALYARLINMIDLQSSLHQDLLQSESVSDHAAAVRQTAAAIKTALSVGSFETLLKTEMAIQRAELERYAGNPEMVESIRKTRADMAEGLKDYKHLKENPHYYHSRGYRERDRTGPGKTLPVDTMRKVLRSQATRVGNFAKNPMLSAEEEEFHKVRVSLLRRAEKLYEQLQMESLKHGN